MRCSLPRSVATSRGPASLVRMLGLRTFLFPASVAVAAVIVTTPRPAEACQPDPCEQSNRWEIFELASPIIAPDGVLRFSAVKNNGDAPVEEALAFVQLTVIDAGGLVVDGAFEHDPDYRSYAWRPVSPLTPGETHQVELVVDNDALAAFLDEEWLAEETWCGENILEVTSFDTSASDLPPLLVPEPELASGHQVLPQPSLNGLVCCDGAMPFEEFTCLDFGNVVWTEGTCSATRGYGTVSAQASFPEEALAPEQIANLAIRMVQTTGNQVRRAQPGATGISLSDDEPFCARMEVLDLAHSEIWEGPEHCVGDDLIDQLGTHDIDPSPGLAACVGQPYVCESDSMRWDPETCVPWGDPPGEDESGDGGSEGDGGTGGGDDADADDGLGSGGEDGDDTVGQDDDGVSGRGCACRADSGGGMPSAPWLLVVGLGWRAARRRRRPGRARG